MSGCWLCDTGQGVFRIEIKPIAGQVGFVIFFEDEPLGCCPTAEAALKRLVQCETYKPASGLDIRRLNVPTVITDWVYAAEPAARSSALHV
ncbi:hypothetical protein [Methylobacterium iners]|uniref:Uncharacterized protein n=1 Tax=Methylobacterium iners TaxID=418707 RepID=A0ABQ4RQE5_9HYPH|nr:hypothetical protein [Methylobacterium iners]GJD92976.1 hypothetical protein OCOJLMKI_0161 [Methylobacterium iners]